MGIFSGFIGYVLVGIFVFICSMYLITKALTMVYLWFVPPSGEPPPAMLAAANASDDEQRNVDIETGIPLTGQIISTLSSSLISEKEDHPQNDSEEQAEGVAFSLVADFGKQGGMLPMIEQPSCSICLVDYAVGDEIRRSVACDHVYHASCCQSFLSMKRECPCCRRPFVNVIAADIDDKNKHKKNKEEVGRGRRGDTV